MEARDNSITNTIFFDDIMRVPSPYTLLLYVMDQHLSAKNSAPGDQMNDFQRTTISPFTLSMHSIRSYEIYLFIFLPF